MQLLRRRWFSLRLHRESLCRRRREKAAWFALAWPWRTGVSGGFPDPLIFALAGIVIVFIVGLFLHQSPAKMAVQGGKNFWTLVPFTMQMVMIIIGGYVVASTPLVQRLIRRLAEIPKTPRGAIAMVALFSMLTSLISWGLSLIFSGLLVRELSRRVKGMDYRAAGAAAYLGLGAVWAMGLSSSAAMLMATKGAIPPSLLNISGLIPLTQTLFLWQSIVTAAVLILVSVLIAYLSAPSAEHAKTAESYGIKHEAASEKLEAKTKPGEWLEYSPLLTILVVALFGWYLVEVFRTSPQGALAALDLNTYNLMFITVGCSCTGAPSDLCGPFRIRSGHRRRADPVSLLRGHFRHDCRHRHFRPAGPPVSRLLTVLIPSGGAYSAILGVFIPSGGSKWVIEAPYVLRRRISIMYIWDGSCRFTTLRKLCPT